MRSTPSSVVALSLLIISTSVACGGGGTVTTTTGIDALVYVGGPDPIYYGQTGVVFGVAVLNVGGTAAGAVQVDGTVDAPLVLNSATGSGWTCTPTSNTYTCQHPGPLNAAGGLPAISLAVTTPVPGSGPSTSVGVCAKVSTKGDGNAANDDQCQRVELLERTADYDVSITKGLLNNTSLNSGSPATYQIVVQNLGPDAVGDPITFTDTLPSFITINGVGAPLAGDWTCNTVAQTVSCTRIPGMLLYETDSILIYVTVADDARGEIENCATLNAAQDSGPVNNTSCHSDTIPEPLPFDVELLKTVWTPYTTGPGMFYQMMITNHGPNPTNGLVKVVDVLPPGLSLTGYSGSILWSCSTAGSTVTCLLPTSIAVGAFEFLGLTVSVAPGTPAPFGNCADIVATGDTDPTNNRSCTESSPQIDLVTTKELVGSITYGGNTTYEVSIANVGNTEIPWPVHLSDPLPLGVYRVGMPVVLSGAFTCSAAYFWSISCSYTGPLPVPIGPLATIQYTVHIPTVAELRDSGITGAFVNCVTGSPTGPDMTPEDNTACAQSPIPHLYELVTAVETRVPPVTRKRMRQTVRVTNTGSASTDTPVLVAFDLPEPVDFLGSVSSAWTCQSDKLPAEHVVCSSGRGALPGELPPLEIDLWVSSALTEGSELSLCYSVLPVDDNAENNSACTQHTVGGAPVCAGDPNVRLLYYGREVQEWSAGLVVGVESFFNDDNGTPITVGTQTRDGDTFETHDMLVVSSEGSSAQGGSSDSVIGSSFAAVEWRGDGEVASIHSYVGDAFLRGHDMLRVETQGAVSVLSVRTVGVDKPMWLSVYDGSDVLLDVLLVEPGSPLVGVTALCGAVGALELEPGHDATNAAGTDAWGLSQASWAAE